MTPPVIIDIEASGFGAGSYPIEVGYVDRCGKPWCSLITPHDDWLHWNKTAEMLHHISRDMLVAHVKSTALVANHLNDTFMNQTIYSDSWLHDFTWLNCLFHAANVSPHFKFQDLRVVLTPFQQSLWHNAKEDVLNQLQISRHLASADALVLQMTWIKTAQLEALTCA